MTWREASARLGRNDLPAALAYGVYRDGTVTEAEDIAKGVEDAWTGCEWPEQAMDADIWMNLIDRAVEDITTRYLHDSTATDRDELPETVTLYRGAIPDHKMGMSWTDDPKVAHWFAHRFDGMRGGKVGTVYTYTFTRDEILARFESGRPGEHEWVVDLTYVEDDDVAEWSEAMASAG